MCEFNGKHIPIFITNSESGGITPDILVEVLNHLDKSEISNRKPVDPPPRLLVDGHRSRLSIPFLRYINNLDPLSNETIGANHSWSCFLGLPNATAYC